MTIPQHGSNPTVDHGMMTMAKEPPAEVGEVANGCGPKSLMYIYIYVCVYVYIYALYYIFLIYLFIYLVS